MKTLDDLMAKLDSLYIPIYVKGKEYPANNPYVLNEINAMLEAGWMKKRYGGLTEPTETLEPEDLQWDDKRLELYTDKTDDKYLVYEELNQIAQDNCEKYNRLSYENNEHLAAEEMAADG
jgi:hypothetical protein